MKKDRLYPMVLGGIALVACLLATLWFGGKENIPTAPAFSRAPVLFDLGNGQSHAFNMEVAETPEQLAYGMMYRKEMAPEDGMIFVFNPAQDATMWMKNTFVSLDMIFVRADGTIAKIVPFTMPLDETKITAGEPVAAVIELKAGSAAKYRINKTSKVKFDGLAPSVAPADSTAPAPVAVVPATPTPAK